MEKNKISFGKILGIALIVTAFINRYIFYTILAVVLFAIISFVISKLVYTKKY